MTQGLQLSDRIRLTQLYIGIPKRRKKHPWPDSGRISNSVHAFFPTSVGKYYIATKRFSSRNTSYPSREYNFPGVELRVGAVTVCTTGVTLQSARGLLLTVPQVPPSRRPYYFVLPLFPSLHSHRRIPTVLLRGKSELVTILPVPPGRNTVIRLIAK